MRELIFAALMAVAAVVVTVGAWQFGDGIGLIVGGFLLAGWSWMALSQ